MRSDASPSALFVWCIGFAYATVLALAFQKLVLPLMPGLHAQYGLLQNDAIQFHEAAAALAEKIRVHGWSEWRLYPLPNSAGNVGILAALYALFGPDPAWFVPVNAAVHALGGVTLYRMGRLLWPGPTGTLGGLIAAALFIAFPSSLQWYAQNHRDAFAIAGSFLLLYPVLELWSTERASGTFWREAALSIIFGAGLIILVRPHLFEIIALGLAAGWVVVLVRTAFQRNLRLYGRHLAIHAILVCAIAVTGHLIPRNQNFDKIVNQQTIGEEPAAQAPVPGPQAWQWHASSRLPRKVDSLLHQVSVIRAHFAYEGRFAGSLVDGDRVPDSTPEALAFVPRALAIGLFAPFPDTWTVRPTAVRLVGAIETAVWYFVAFGVLLFAWRRPTNAFLVGLAFALVLLTVFGYTYPVVGTLYRERYGVWLFVALLGATGWALVLRKALAAAERAAHNDAPQNQAALASAPAMSNVAAAGAVVLVITFLTFLGFVIRDLTLAKTFGMTADLGGFFSAAMLPMFFVSFLSFPLSDAMTKRFLELDASGKQRLAQSLLGVGCVILFMTGLAVAFFADSLVAMVMSSADPGQISRAASMLRWFTPILMLSGWTVIGNAILNLHHRARAAALAQMTVPVIAVASIWLLQDMLGVYSAIVGMLAGMAMNIALVAYLTRGLGILLLPRVVRTPLLRPVLENYLLLAIAAVFTAAAVPLNYAFAGSLDGGSIPLWALGSKMVQLVSGMAGVAIGAVVLPHLGHLIAGRRAHQLGSDTFFLLVAGTWIAILCAIGVDLFAEPVVVLMLEGGKITHEQSLQLAAILSLGALQLPPAIASALVLKLAAVSGSSWRAAAASAAGFAANLIGNFLLVPAIGLLGIALASTIGAALSAASMMLLTRQRSGIALPKTLSILAAWTVMVGISVSFHFHSDAALAATLMVLAVVAWANWRQFLAGDPARARSEPSP